MATVPAEITWVSGQVVTAAQLNTNLRDAINFLISQPVCQARQTVAQSLTSGTGAAITLDTEDVDNDNMHSTVTNTSRFTAVTAGRYRMGGGVGFASNATGARVAWYAVNGTNINGSGTEMTPVGGGGVTLVPTRSFSVFLSVGQFVEIFGLQTSGGALNTDVTTLDQPSMLAQWIGTT